MTDGALRVEDYDFLAGGRYDPGIHPLLGLRWLERLEMAKTVVRAAADATWEEALKLEGFAEANCFRARPWAARRKVS